MIRVVAFALALVLAGCSTDEPAPTPRTSGQPGPTEEVSEPSPPGERPAPRLVIGSPAEGEEVTLPMLVAYSVEGFDVGPGAGYLSVRPGRGDPVRVELDGPSGEVSIEDLPEGSYDLSFALARRDGVEVAHAVVRRVTVVQRGAGGGGIGY
ncbi:MAG TPA: hypothetical protein VM840_01440 [Actinomycetota bacterium]|nr:hypothetical protein [Actinomycetota bacterium]